MSSDPAAAPLGTDDEAAGHPPTAEQIQLAAAVELRTGPKASRPTAVYPSSQSSGSFAIILAIGGLILIAAALFLYLT